MFLSINSILMLPIIRAEVNSGFWRKAIINKLDANFSYQIKCTCATNEHWSLTNDKCSKWIYIYQSQRLWRPIANFVIPNICDVAMICCAVRVTYWWCFVIIENWIRMNKKIFSENGSSISQEMLMLYSWSSPILLVSFRFRRNNRGAAIRLYQAIVLHLPIMTSNETWIVEHNLKTVEENMIWLFTFYFYSNWPPCRLYLF